MLKLQWTAKFKNEEVLNQFENNNENLFLEVQKKFENLEYFILNHIEKPLSIIVDLKSGLVFINSNLYQYGTWWGSDLTSKKKNVRLIYFRRNRVITSVGSVLKTVFHTVVHFIGYQYNDISGRNKKVILQIDDNGNIIIGD